MGTWQVRPHSDGWQVLTPGGTRACAPTGGQHEAVQTALGLLVYEGGELLVHSERGGSYRLSAGAGPPASVRTLRSPDAPA
jgi:hypothetical protein